MSSDKIETLETNFSNEEVIPVTQIDHLENNQQIITRCVPNSDDANHNTPESPVTSDKTSSGSGHQRISAPLASEEALESEMDVVSSSDVSSDKQLLNSMDGRHDNSISSSKPGLITLSRTKIFPEGDSNPTDRGKHQMLNDVVRGDMADVDRAVRQDGDNPKHSAIYNFFRREKNAFMKESKKKLRLIPKQNTNINFGEIVKEFKGEGKDSPERHWKNQAQKREGEKCPELLSTVLIGLFFTLAPNCAIVLDYIAAQEYIGGNWYLKYNLELDHMNTTCRNSTGGMFGLEYLKVRGKYFAANSEEKKFLSRKYQKYQFLTFSHLP